MVTQRQSRIAQRSVPDRQPTDPGQASEPPGLRIIKKYPNRRLYDSQRSCYVTLAEIKSLVLASEAFAVRDARTGEDLTRSILLQIILEEEAAGMPLFTEAALAHLIRFYGHAMQPFLGQTLEQQLQAMTEWQTRLGAQAQSLQGPALESLLSEYLAQSQLAMSQMQHQMQRQTEQMLAAFGIKI